MTPPPLRWFRTALHRAIETPLRLLSPALFRRLVLVLIRRRIATLPPTEALKLLMQLDFDLYPMHGQAAVAYGSGVHPKHRHLNYHDFFIRNVTGADRILDIGCGIGVLAHDVADKTGAEIVGIDIVEGNIEKARRLHAHPRVTYFLGDALRRLPDGPFTTIVLSNVLEHLPGRPGFLRTLQERFHPRQFLIRVPLYERDWRVPVKDELGIDSRLDDTHEIEYTQEIFDREMAEAGLRVASREVRWGEIWAVVEAGG